jgi:predicted RNA-binding protein with PUA-like domain
MNYFLAKSEPDTYSIADLKRDGKTTWDGVKNPQALQAIRSMRSGDRILIYHSGGVSAIVGWATAVSDPRPDPEDPKLTVIDLQFGGEFPAPTALASIKATGQFADFRLVRQSRLSTMAVPGEFIEWLRSQYKGIKF